MIDRDKENMLDSIMGNVDIPDQSFFDKMQAKVWKTLDIETDDIEDVDFDDMQNQVMQSVGLGESRKINSWLYMVTSIAASILLVFYFINNKVPETLMDETELAMIFLEENWQEIPLQEIVENELLEEDVEFVTEGDEDLFIFLETNDLTLLQLKDAELID